MFTNKQYTQGHRSAQLLPEKGGFADALAKAYFRADMTNARRLYEAFPEYFQLVEVEDAEV